MPNTPRLAQIAHTRGACATHLHLAYVALGPSKSHPDRPPARPAAGILQQQLRPQRLLHVPRPTRMRRRVLCNSRLRLTAAAALAAGCRRRPINAAATVAVAAAAPPATAVSREAVDDAPNVRHMAEEPGAHRLLRGRRLLAPRVWQRAVRARQAHQPVKQLALVKEV
eukprot:366232-Chlamydomonas_euryale.AAC.27